MISFRYHIVSLVAVLLALGAGVALGSGPLERENKPETTSTTGAPQSSAEDEAYTRVNDGFAASLQAGMTNARLRGRTVTLLVLPGAAPDQVTALTSAVTQAGASLAGAVRISEDLVNPSKRQLVDELGGQLEASATKVIIDTGAGTYDRIGALLAFAVSTAAPAGDPVDQQGKGILAGLSTAGLLSMDKELQRRGNLVLVVAGPAGDGGDADAGGASIVTSLAKALDAGSGGVVVAGPLSAADPAGVLTAVRNDTAAVTAVSTVDIADVPAGRIITVLALAEQAAKGAGQYGGGAGVTGLYPGVGPIG
ncbi:MAG TPA: copper transporter [Nocardioidaceae bacterium]|nr:copper transporter [Nocardioidaceae bacterium]